MAISCAVIHCMVPPRDVISTPMPAVIPSVLLTPTEMSVSSGSPPKIVNHLFSRFNPLSPHDALKHHFTSLKTDLIFLQQRDLERKYP